jgi:hypothetical protein
VAIQFKDGKILFVDGKIAMDPACCCGCDWCACDVLRYDAIFSGDMGDDYSGTYSSVRKESYGDEGCQFFFGDDSPIGDIYFDGTTGEIGIHAQPVPGYSNYGDAYGYWSGCPIILHDPWMLEWANGWPPTEYWADYLKIYCGDAGALVAPGWTQDSEEIP